MNRRHRLAVLASVVAALLVPAAASAAPTWLSPVDVSPPINEEATPGDVGIDSGGNVLATWTEGTNPARKVFGSIRPAGATFLPKEQLSGAGDAIDPQVAINDRGDAVVVWLEVVGGVQIVRYAVRPAGGPFTTAQNLSNPGDAIFGVPEVAIAPEGTAVAVWSRNNGANEIVEAAVKPANSTTFGGATRLSDLGVDSGSAVVGLDASGGAVVAWEQPFAATQVESIMAAVRPAGGSFTTLAPVFTEPPDTTPANGNFSHIDAPKLAVAPNGRATLAWAFKDETVTPPALGRHRIMSAARGTSGNFGTVEDNVSDPNVDSGFAGALDVAVDDADNALVAWSADIVRGAVRKSGASFGDPRPISGPGISSADPSVDFDGAGTAIVAFRGSAGGVPTVQAVSLPRDGVFSAVTDIQTQPAAGSLDDATALDVGRAGDAVLLFGRNDGANESVRAVGYDGSPPSLSALAVPPTGTAGIAIPMSASAADVWSAFDIAWDFGDGGFGAGASVSHAYAVPGTYTVALRLTDAVGNVSTATRPIQVAPLVTDADGDGSPSNVDCNDNNPGIHPGAFDRPGDGIDQDCADGDAKRTVTAEMTWSVSPGARVTKFNSLLVTKLQRGARVFVTCSGKGCPFKKRRRVSFKRNARTVQLSKVINPKRKGRPRRVSELRVGAKLIVAVTAPDRIGRRFTLTMRKGRGPRLAKACLAVGSPTKRTSCT